MEGQHALSDFTEESQTMGQDTEMPDSETKTENDSTGFSASGACSECGERIHADAPFVLCQDCAKGIVESDRIADCERRQRSNKSIYRSREDLISGCRSCRCEICATALKELT